MSPAAIKAVVAGGALLLAMLLGAMLNNWRNGEEIATLKGTVATKDAALAAASSSLRSAASAIRRQNAENKAKVDRANDERDRAARAGKIAAATAQEAEARALEYRRQLNDAGKRTPACASLLATDVEAVCGFISP